MDNPIVYFTREISKDSILALYKCLGIKLKGNVGVKLHSGEPGNQNFLGPEYWTDIVNYVGGTVCECNTAYDGGRNTTKKHYKTMQAHGFTDEFKVDILDAEGPDLCLDIKDGVTIKKNYVGKDIINYDSLLVLSHFKGHPMGGYGGALKQLSIGLASSYGKAYIHGAGEPSKKWTQDRDLFLDSMADAAKSIIDFFKEGNIAYINVMENMSVDCDCCSVAEDPCMEDIGVLASLDPVAIDEACIDLVYSSNDKGKDHLIERIESRNGLRTIESAYKIGCGNKKYVLKEVKF